jgi:hypothetical protein
MALRLRRAATLALALGLVAAPAYAATGSAPVTAPDAVTVRAGDPDELDVTANDSDPDGDELQVCRIGSAPRALRATVSDGRLSVLPRRTARGTYSLTYYACDTSYLTPGTVTVRVRPPGPALTVTALTRLPGKVRIVNTYPHRTFHCEWRRLGSDRVEGRVTVEPRSRVVVRVQEPDVEFECTSGNLVIGAGFATA